MIHDIDVIRSIFPNEPIFPRYAKGNQDVMMAFMEIGYTPYRIPVYLSASRVSMKRTRSLYIEDTVNTLELDYFAQTITSHKKASRYEFTEGKFMTEGVIENIQVNKAEPLKTELTTFVKCAATGVKFPVTIEEALKNLWICECIKLMAAKETGDEAEGVWEV